MNRIVKIIGATVLALTVSGAAVGPSLAAGHWIPHSHAGVRGGHFGHFHRSYSGWSGGSYYNPGFYGYGYDYGYDPGAAIVGGLVGGVFGALADRALTLAAAAMWRAASGPTGPIRPPPTPSSAMTGCGTPAGFDRLK